MRLRIALSRRKSTDQELKTPSYLCPCRCLPSLSCTFRERIFDRSLSVFNQQMSLRLPRPSFNNNTRECGISIFDSFLIRSCRCSLSLPSGGASTARAGFAMALIDMRHEGQETSTMTALCHKNNSDDDLLCPLAHLWIRLQGSQGEGRWFASLEFWTQVCGRA